MGVDIADSAFVCNEAFVNDSVTDILSITRVFREYSFVWFLVDSVEWLEWSVRIVWDSSAECFGLGVTVWTEVSEVFGCIICVVTVYVVDVEREWQSKPCVDVTYFATVFCVFFFENCSKCALARSWWFGDNVVCVEFVFEL